MTARQILVSLTVYAFLSSNYAFAADLENCRSIEQDLDRLACYDEMSGRTATVEEVPTASAWKVSIESSEMTDDTNVFISVDSDEVINCGWSTQKTTLMLRCGENKTSAYFVTGCHMTSSDYNTYGDVTYRLDATKAKTQGFKESTNNRALGLWSGGRAIPFIKSLLGHDRMLARMTPFNENAFTAEFNISQLDEVIQPLRDACHW